MTSSSVLPAIARRRRRGSPPAPPAVDARVRARFRDGDPDAVRVVYREYGQLVYAVVFKVLGDRGLCEEAAQQTFLQAWRGAGRFDPSRELGPWLATIARRVAIDLYRREARRAARPLEAIRLDDPAIVSAPNGGCPLRRLGGSTRCLRAADKRARRRPPAALRRPHTRPDRETTGDTGGYRQVTLISRPSAPSRQPRAPARAEPAGPRGP